MTKAIRRLNETKWLFNLSRAALVVATGLAACAPRIDRKNVRTPSVAPSEEGSLAGKTAAEGILAQPVLAPEVADPSVVQVESTTMTFAGGTLRLATGIATGAEVRFPEGALHDPILLSVEVLDASAFGPEQIGKTLRLKPEGSVFSAPVQVVLPIPRGSADVQLWTRASEDTPWELVKVQRANAETGELVGWVEHFSQFAARVTPSSDSVCICKNHREEALCAEPFVKESTGHVVCRNFLFEGVTGKSCEGHLGPLALRREQKKGTNDLKGVLECKKEPRFVGSTPCGPCSKSRACDQTVPESEYMNLYARTKEGWSVAEMRDVISRLPMRTPRTPAEIKSSKDKIQGFRAKQMLEWAQTLPSPPPVGDEVAAGLRLRDEARIRYMEDLDRLSPSHRFTRAQAEAMLLIAESTTSLVVLAPGADAANRYVDSESAVYVTIFGDNPELFGRSFLETLLHEAGHALGFSGPVRRLHGGDSSEVFHTMIYKETIANLVAFGGDLKRAFTNTTQVTYGLAYQELLASDRFASLDQRTPLEQFRILRYYAEKFQGVQIRPLSALLKGRATGCPRSLEEEALKPECGKFEPVDANSCPQTASQGSVGALPNGGTGPSSAPATNASTNSNVVAESAPATTESSVEVASGGAQDSDATQANSPQSGGGGGGQTADAAPGAPDNPHETSPPAAAESSGGEGAEGEGAESTAVYTCSCHTDANGVGTLLCPSANQDQSYPFHCKSYYLPGASNSDADGDSCNGLTLDGWRHSESGDPIPTFSSHSGYKSCSRSGE